MEQNNTRRAEDAERLPAEQLQWEAPVGRTVMDAADELRKDWQLKGTGPYADPIALGKLKALAEAAHGASWKYERLSVMNGTPKITDHNGRQILVTWNVDYAFCEFIAAANPAEILRIYALVSQQAARIAELESDLSEVRTGCEGAAQPVLEGAASSLIPAGWKLCTADFSIQAASGEPRPGSVTLIRDLDGQKAWHALSDDWQERDDFQLYAYGMGSTIEEALIAARASVEGK